jgi:hypothetical protein
MLWAGAELVSQTCIRGLNAQQVLTFCNPYCNSFRARYGLGHAAWVPKQGPLCGSCGEWFAWSCAWSCVWDYQGVCWMPRVQAARVNTMWLLGANAAVWCMLPGLCMPAHL